MRWVFFSLVVVNLVYLGWQSIADTVMPEPPVRLEQTASPGHILRLLSEDPQPRREVAAGSRRGSEMCPVVGPWPDKGEAARARIQLEAAGLQPRVEAVSVQKDRLHWVYLAPYSSREKALVVLADLQSHGVDSFIVKTGEYVNAISLGYFSSSDSAEGLRMQMRSAGYPAFVTETSRAVTEYWLLMPGEAANSPALDDFMVGNPGVTRDMAACPEPDGRS